MSSSCPGHPGKTGASSYPLWPKNHFGADSNWEGTDSGEALCHSPCPLLQGGRKDTGDHSPSPMWGHRRAGWSSPDTGLWEPCSWTFCLQTGEKQTCAVYKSRAGHSATAASKPQTTEMWEFSKYPFSRFGERNCKAKKKKCLTTTVSERNQRGEIAKLRTLMQRHGRTVSLQPEVWNLLGEGVFLNIWFISVYRTFPLLGHLTCGFLTFLEWLCTENKGLFSLNQKVVICHQLKDGPQQGLIQDRSGPQGFRGVTPQDSSREGPLLR